jgi:RNA polymerase sigma-70 factor (ECF subfamily)
MATIAENQKASSGYIYNDLIEECKRGEQKAQFRIYKLYYKEMYNISLRIVNNPIEAEDIMQESFLAAFEQIGSLKGEVSFGVWLEGIVQNRSFDFITLKGQKQTHISEEIMINLNEISFQLL